MFAPDRFRTTYRLCDSTASATNSIGSHALSAQAESFRLSGHTLRHAAHRHDLFVVVLWTVVSCVTAVALQNGHRTRTRRSDVAFAIRNFILSVGNEATTIVLTRTPTQEQMWFAARLLLLKVGPSRPPAYHDVSYVSRLVGRSFDHSRAFSGTAQEVAEGESRGQPSGQTMNAGVPALVM
jgi:hypothetical protein